MLVSPAARATSAGGDGRPLSKFALTRTFAAATKTRDSLVSGRGGLGRAELLEAGTEPWPVPSREAFRSGIGIGSGILNLSINACAPPNKPIDLDGNRAVDVIVNEKFQGCQLTRDSHQGDGHAAHDLRHNGSHEQRIHVDRDPFRRDPELDPRQDRASPG
jgi:hypothetical protein